MHLYEKENVYQHKNVHFAKCTYRTQNVSLFKLYAASFAQQRQKVGGIQQKKKKIKRLHPKGIMKKREMFTLIITVALNILRRVKIYVYASKEFLAHRF